MGGNPPPDDALQDASQTAVSNETSQPTRDLYIVGIGASAGGLEPIERFFDNMPADTGMAFVVVQHLSPDFKSLMDELLARHTDMPIHRVEDGMPVEPNGIYLIPPKKNMVLSYGKLLLTEQDPSVGPNLPIDVFFRSLAQDAGDRAVAVILSGTGSDGSRGVREIHEADGLVVVQDTESAAFDGMPRNAVATGLADVVARPEEMPDNILRYVQKPSAFLRAHDAGLEAAEPELVVDDSEMLSIFRLFRDRYGIDFSFYRATTIRRRLDRRVKLSRFRNLSSYLTQLEQDPHELDLLYRDLLVEVTHFFRDPEAYERLQREVIPEILARARDHGEVRVWVPGCATGEEAYSLTMLFHHVAGQLKQTVDIKVFATDIHQASLESASAGVFSQASVDKLPAVYKQRYFSKRGDLYHVNPDIRQMVIFAPHDITKDPPFTRMDLISCRNVLIYLEAIIQRRVISLFHFGLRVGGILWLGPAETVGDLAKEFDLLDSHWRIFRKLRDVRLPNAGKIAETATLNQVVHTRPSYISTRNRGDKAWLIPEAYEDLLMKYVPPSLLVNEQHELVHSFGKVHKLMVQPEGSPTLDVLKMVRGDLQMAVSAALHRAVQKKDAVMFNGVRAETDDGEKLYKLIVEPYAKGSERMFLICLEEMEPVEPPEPQAQNLDTADHSTERINMLERELSYTKETLQSTVEQLEASNEELQSTNEELVASNEELQSTNEELHSVNEELYTVNAEHQRKIDELTQLTNDMDNLLKSTGVGTIFLDRDLRIRKFTPDISEAFQIIEQDVGRSIEQFAYNFDNPELLDDVREVLDTGKPREREVFTRDKKPFLQRIMPYRTDNDTLDGVVLTFIDLSALKETELKLEQSEHQLRMIADNLPALIGYVDRDFCYRFVNQRYADAFGFTKAEMIGKPVEDVVGSEAFGRSLPRMQAALCGESEMFENSTTKADGTTIWGQISYVPDIDGAGYVNGFYVLVGDITKRKFAEEALKQHVEDLAEKNSQLEQFNKLATGREERMIDLKREVNQLCEQFGQPQRYDLSRIEQLNAEHDA